MSQDNNNMPKTPESKPAFKNDTSPQAFFLSQKCSRLASALYAATRHLPDAEPLKSEIRQCALSLVEFSRGSGQSNRTSIGPTDTLGRIRDQLTIARDGGLLSRQNHRVFVEEIDGLIETLQGDDAFLRPQIDSRYFDVDTPESQDTSESRNKTDADSSNNIEANGQASNSDTVSEDTGDEKPRSAKDRRRQKILDLFKTTDEITVNDVTEVINGYSTKTIQRDLKALVKEGRLEKHGKRRWTSYTRA